MTPQDLLELQLNDSAIDQLRSRIPKLPEVVAAAAADAEVAAWERRDTELRQQIAAFEAAITATEHESARVTAQRSRLEQQLKTVIAPREAEALMHEIATLNAQRSALDDTELEAMDGMGAAEAAAAANTENEQRLRDAAAAASVSAAAARADAAVQLDALTAASTAMRAAGDAAMLRRYDELRIQLNGIAVAKLNDKRCEGCHIDMSRAEADDLKRMPPDEFGECPNCGRLLVR